MPEVVDGCPCLLVAPCTATCSCAYPEMSGGCYRCAKYGNHEQRLSMAAILAIKVDQVKAIMDENRRLGSANLHYVQKYSELLRKYQALVKDEKQ